jgi:hypothetical protein
MAHAKPGCNVLQTGGRRARIETAMSMNDADRWSTRASDGHDGPKDRWRIQPTVFDVPVRVYGTGPGNATFYKDALVLFANAGGGVLLLNVPVCDGQPLLITNMAWPQCKITPAASCIPTTGEMARSRSASSSRLPPRTSGRSPRFLPPNSDKSRQPNEFSLTPPLKKARVMAVPASGYLQ